MRKFPNLSTSIIFILICILAFVSYQCSKKSKNEPITRGNSVWINGGFVAKNQKIIFLDTTYFDSQNKDTAFNRNASISRILAKYREAGVKDVQTSTKHTCDCNQLVLLEGEGLENIQIDTHPDGSDGGNNDSGNPKHGGSFTFDVDSPVIMDVPLGKKIKIGILDTGLKLDSLDGTRFLPGYNAIDGTKIITDDSDSLHGTNVARMLASIPRERADILPIKINGKSGGNLFDAMCGMLYAKKQGVSLINCSWGYEGLINIAFEKVVKSLTDANILIVCSTGNKKSLLSPAAIFRSPEEAEAAKTVSIYPAMFSKCNPNVIAVTNDTLGNYSEEYAKIIERNETFTSFSAALVSRFIVQNYNFETQEWVKKIAERSTNPSHRSKVENQTITVPGLY